MQPHSRSEFLVINVIIYNCIRTRRTAQCAFITKSVKLNGYRRNTATRKKSKKVKIWLISGTLKFMRALKIVNKYKIFVKYMKRVLK